LNNGVVVPYVDLGSLWLDIRDKALPLIDEILTSGKYLEHGVVTELESKLSSILGVKHVITLNSGTDALLMSLYAMGISRGDEVITVPNSFIASVAAIEHIGATTVFADVGDDHLLNTDKIEGLITSKTKAIMPVHLEGKMCDMQSIHRIASKYGLKIIEDAAQAFGSKFGELSPGQNSDVACFSLHPLKNLNGLGDGGFIATNDSSISNRVLRLRNHGQLTRNKSDEFGFVSRLDSIQAAILLLKLNDFKEVIAKRRKLASIYDSLLCGSNVKTPSVSPSVFHTYHLYVIEVENREELQELLLNHGIETRIHYPIIIPEQEAFKKKYYGREEIIPVAMAQANRILSLPIHQNLTEKQVEFVAQILKENT